jgi:hypothetical protein
MEEWRRSSTPLVDPSFITEKTYEVVSKILRTGAAVCTAVVVARNIDK